jgi:N-acetylneuraminate lyase
MTHPFEMIAAPHTPFQPDGSLNLDAIARQAEVLLRNGVAGVFCCGTTGEGISMTTAERQSVTERWVRESKGRLRVIAHVGHNCQRDAMALAAHAKSVGAAGVAAVAPHFLKPTTAEQLASFFAPVAAACAPLPFFFYDIPSLTDVRISSAAFLEVAAPRIPNLGGVKFTNIDVITLQECVTAGGGKYEIFFGCDEMLVAALAVGVRRAVGSTYNYASRLHLEIIQAFDQGDHEKAKTLQRKSVAMVRVLEKYGGPVRAGKATMSLLGVDCGPVRPPLVPMTQNEIAGLHQELNALGVLSTGI